MSLSMSVMDSMKDKASRLIPTPYTDLVEQATSELLLVPDYEKIIFLCDSANSKEEHAVDLVRAVRRRMDNKSAKIRYFTIVLLEAMVKNCGLPVHIEIAETKGLLVDLVAAAAKRPSADGEADAKKAALQLILNMSIWFGEHPSPKVKPLTKLVDAVRAEGATFDGLDPDLSVSMKMDASPPHPGNNGAQSRQPGASRVRRQNRAQRHADFAGHGRGQRGDSNPNQPRIVTAIPLILPTDDELSGMLDAAMLLVECMNTAEANGTPIHGDEIVANIGVQVRRDHKKLSQMISSGAEIENMEMMLTVCDSQMAVIQRVAEAIRAQGAQGHMPAELHDMPDMPSPTQHQAPAQPSSSSGIDTKTRLTRFFMWYNPDKLSDVDTILAKYQGREGELFDALHQKYGPEPAASAFAPGQLAEMEQQTQQTPTPDATPPAYPPRPGYGETPAPVVPSQQQEPPVSSAPAPTYEYPDQMVTQQNLYAPATAPQEPTAPTDAGQPAPSAPISTNDVRVAMDIDDVPPPPPPAPPAEVKPQAPTIDELFMGISNDPPSSAAPADEPSAAPALPAQQQPAPAAFPAPTQSLNPETQPTNDMTKTDEPTNNVGTTGSLNDDGDDFDAFLNNRLANTN